ncbi:reverse transcriptase zinc-binding domain-containing protein [Artemisia annua]|uniref:Reverse transcriptase zinc-binding domain-containing protein n=1 Tax=Artemisia annua TaxID=35608 RepID=A0A2U1MMZ7_ARTAN|nr:reverse transcriptase zinc-binding domain-containing protein [Artemisia annua]
MVVNDIVINNECKWPNEWLSKHPSLATVATCIIDESKEDLTVWEAYADMHCEKEDVTWPDEWLSKHPSLATVATCIIDESKEELTVWEAYADMHCEKEDVTWSKIVWFSQNIPKHAFILWLAAQKRLTTQDRMKKWGSYDMMVCFLCTSDCDSNNHLFFQCSFASQFWNKVKQKIGLSSNAIEWKDIVRNMALKYNGSSIDSIVRRLGLAASVYLIWQKRNF